MSNIRLVVFRLDAQRYALPLATVERVVRAVEVTPLPKAPPIVFGVIDVEGRLLAVFNLRRRFGLPEREILPGDQFVIARTVSRAVALVVDEAQEVIQYPALAVVDPAQIVPGLEHIRGVAKLADELVLIHDLESFLSPDEARALDAAMRGNVPC